ncbi:glycosyltransferase [Desulfosediminicola sp.]|uniref:glycosyltransferase n=1 Tax=Desulfosediminicola sp. TaxID=2886825 RepID=UPI003AF26DDC
MYYLESAEKIRIVALVATKNREDLFKSRSLPSILQQTYPCDRIVVVEDISAGKKITGVQQFCHDHVGLVDYLRNRRTSGAAGAWNSGLDHIARSYPDPSSVFVAILDDDDAWKSNYIDNSLTQIRKGAKVIATPFQRIVGPDSCLTVFPPKHLCAGDFLVGNPGVQASNLIVRLDSFLEAGCYDEALQSCTDRDLCIRLAQLHAEFYSQTIEVAVQHYACVDRERLCTPKSPARVNGLTTFWQKYNRIMTVEQKRAFCARAEKYFGWQPAAEVEASAPKVSCDYNVSSEAVESFQLVVGLIVDGQRIGNMKGLFDDFLHLQNSGDIDGLDILLLQNSAEQHPITQLSDVIEDFRKEGLRVHLISPVDVNESVKAGELPEFCKFQGSQLGIAPARSALQAYVYHFAKPRKGAVAWIIDDDMRLNPLIDSPDGSKRKSVPFIYQLQKLKGQKVDIAIGRYTGAAPLPASATTRVQLVDLVYNLRWLNSLPGDFVVPKCQSHNSQLMSNRRDYYYDLSHIETDRLEQPFLLEPAFEGETVEEARIRLLSSAERILVGEQIFRPLMLSASEIEEFSIEDCHLHRGGNTFILNIDVLRDSLNPAPMVHGRPTRRSDMNWALLQKKRGRRIVNVPIGVFHDRGSLEPPLCFDVAAIADDIQGYAIFSALQDVMEDERLDYVERVEKYLEERVAAFRLSFQRIRGLACELLSLAKSGLEHSDAWQDFSNRLNAMYPVNGLTEIEKKVAQLTVPKALDFYSEMQSLLSGPSNERGDTNCINEQLQSQRKLNALAAVNAVAGERSNLSLLGYGCEGTVLTDGVEVFKVIDYVKQLYPESFRTLLKRCVGQWPDTQSLYPLTGLSQNGLSMVITYPFEESEPYRGGHGPGMLDLMVECYANRLICRNIHPKNLRVVDRKVRLIDYGSDLRFPNDESTFDVEFIRMCRRAYLSWRWWFRKDLDILLRASIHDGNLPELEGFNYFYDAICLGTGQRLVSDPVIERAMELSPKRVLDYGCGKGRLSAELLGHGAEVVAYDPNTTLTKRWAAYEGSGLHTTHVLDDAMRRGPFDLVICRRVACLIDDAQLIELLDNLRKSVSKDGRVLFALCHPAYTPFHTTPEAVLFGGEKASREQHFIWHKRLRSTGRIMTEFHRPEHRIKRMLRRAGLRVVSRYERHSIDTERFEPISDLLVFELEPVKAPDTTLLIKVCAMDAECLELQVRHLVAQLEEPAGFARVVLTIDSKEDQFSRQFAKGNLEILIHKAQELKKEGWIDDIVFGSKNIETIKALNLRWLGVASSSTHAGNGAQLTSVFEGFERCQTRFVLHTDLDIMVCRMRKDHNYLDDMQGVLSENKDGVTVAFNIAHDADVPYTSESNGMPWRTESRIGLLDLKRLTRILPLPNSQTGEMPNLPWHRSLDLALKTGRGSSWRGGDHNTFFIHPQNERKGDVAQWMNILSQVERGNVPHAQMDKVDLAGSYDDWLQPERTEPYIFVIAGRNVAPGRFRRCLNSVLQQQRDDWGCVVIDDASSPSISSELAEICKPHEDQITFIKQKVRRGLLANMVDAIRNRCGNPQSVIITLDADDCLIGSKVLDTIACEYHKGVDVTVGSMLRTDKYKEYPTDLSNPRKKRGGNVWQHLRTFRKYLFDRIPDSELRVDGEYADLANDWFYMLPIIELAEMPKHITSPLYLHEPGGERSDAQKAERDSIIAELVHRQAMSLEDVKNV